jgi:hypothetical protein
MANPETQLVDDLLLQGRRRLLRWLPRAGGAALAGLAMGGLARPAYAATYSDNDLLNFALNLEFLEANFYYLAAFGCTINAPNAAAIAAGAPAAGIPITGSVGTAGTVSGGSKVAFTTTSAGAYATEVAIEEGKHVLALQAALGSAAVAQPAINLGTAWQTLAVAAGVAGGASFSPYTSDANFLLGAYVFEDVGVTAYLGAAPLFTSASNLETAAGLLSVEGYHAATIRTALNTLDPTGSLGYVTITNQISTLRASLAKAAATATSVYDSSPDDFGLAATTVSLAGAAGVTATKLTDADATNAIAFSRAAEQVINIVTGGGAISGTTLVSPATGVFFPAGLNGYFK